LRALSFFSYLFALGRQLSSVVEQRFCKPSVVGSNPTAGSIGKYEVKSTFRGSENNPSLTFADYLPTFADMKRMIEKTGSVSVRIYKRSRWKANRKLGKRSVYEVADYTGGRRVFRTFTTEDDARKEAKRIADQLSSGNAIAASMTSSQAQSYGRAMEFIRPTGDSLETAAERYAAIVKILGSGERAIAAAKAFAESDKLAVKTVKTVQQVIDLMLVAKGDKEKRTVSDLKNRLNKFAERFGSCPIASITHPEIQEWLDGMKTSGRDKLNYRSKVGSLFRWARPRGYVLRNPIDNTEKPDVKNGVIEFYAPQELARLIAAASPDFLPCLLIGAFAGLRASEIQRLKWSDVNFARGYIVASAKKAGTPSNRLVPIQPNLASWLAPYANRTGNVWTGTAYQFDDAQQATAAATATEELSALKWKHNGLRHSFISYRLAVLKDDKATALEAGNSRETIHKHYKVPVPEDDAKAWFAVAPVLPANVMNINC
jgi:integrase